MVAVRMVSEGVDVPRLAVGVYATSHLHAAVLRPGGRPLRAGPAARRDRLGVPALVPMLLGSSRTSSSSNATTCSTARSAARTTCGPRRRTCSPRPSRPQGRGSTEDELRLRGAGVRGELRPGALRRRRVRHAAAAGQRRGGRLPGHPRPARARPRADAAADAARPGRSPSSAASRTPRPTGRCPPRSGRWSATSSCWSCAANSTPGRRLAPPDRPAARRDPQRAAPRLRRPAQRGGHRGQLNERIKKVQEWATRMR